MNRTPAACAIMLACLMAFSTSGYAQQVDIHRMFPGVVLYTPVDIRFPPGNGNRMYIVELAGAIKSISNRTDATDLRLVLDIHDRVVAREESGMLSMAFHPDFQNNGQFFVHYISRIPSNPDSLISVVSRFLMSSEDPMIADPDSEEIVLILPQPFTTHNGGALAFGPDGYLYISFGDGGYSENVETAAINAQDPSNFYGSILRIDVDRTTDSTRYSIPPGNPFVGNQDGWREEIWAYGFRNPWRMSFTPDRRLLIGDVGQSSWEEINIVEKGANYGWPIMEGTVCYHPPDTCSVSGLYMPVLQYFHDETNGGSIIGGHVYRGTQYPALTNHYVFGDFMSGRIWKLVHADPGVYTKELICATELPITSFGADANGDLYFSTIAGEVYRLGIEPVAHVSDAAAGTNAAVSVTVVDRQRISFSVPNPCRVRIDLYGPLGRNYRTLIDDVVAAGTHHLELETQGLPSGTYFCRLHTIFGNAITRFTVDR